MNVLYGEKNSMKQHDVVVIGAGPSGLFCAIHASYSGHRVLLLEKNADPGVKLLLSGSGQCNITHTGEIRDFLSHYGEHGKQVKPALFGFTNQDLIGFFRKRGLAMMAEENGKVFPETHRSADVLAVLMKECKERDIDLHCGEPVTGVTRTADGFEITTSKAIYRSLVLVIATGGSSYPKTGSTGDGYQISASLGQPLTDIAPALTPLLIRKFPFSAFSGMSFECMQFSIWRAGKKVADRKGDVLFTHLGLSGPGILDASRDIHPDDVIKLSFVGNLKREEFAADLAQRLMKNRSCQISTLLAAYPVPERLNRKLLNLSGIPEDLRGSHFSAEQRSRLITNCTEFPLTVEAPGGFAVAMVTRGGVALDSLNLKTLESKIIPNLYFAGEVLDIDGDTGGYNLQAAFSTGFLVGRSIRKN
jgi:predicted Rossmann fold flavoprotein